MTPGRTFARTIIIIVIVTWTVLSWYIYWSETSYCLAEVDRLKMAVERKDRFVELLRDHVDELKHNIASLTMKKNRMQKQSQEIVYVLKELRVSNETH